MQAAFFLAAVAVPPVVLGRRLRPLCPGHVLILESMDNAFALGMPATLPDLVAAVEVCSRTTREAREWLEAGVGKVDQEALTRRCQEFPPETWDREIEAMQGYVAVFGAVPEHWRRKRERPLRAPTMWALVVGLLKAIPGAVTWDEAWDFPVCALACVLSTANALAGDDSLRTEDDDALAARLRERQAALKRQQAKPRRRGKGRT